MSCGPANNLVPAGCCFAIELLYHMKTLDCVISSIQTEKSRHVSSLCAEQLLYEPMLSSCAGSCFADVEPSRWRVRHCGRSARSAGPTIGQHLPIVADKEPRDHPASPARPVPLIASNCFFCSVDQAGVEGLRRRKLEP